MNLQMLSFLICIVLILTFISIALIYLSFKSKKYLYFAIIPVVALFAVLFFGNVEDNANGAKINTDGTMTLYLNYHNDNYSQKIHILGSTKIEYTSNKNFDKINKRIKVTRNLLKGTKVLTYKDNKALKYEEK